MAQKTSYLTNNIKLQQIESRLCKYTYLSKESLPGAADSIIFSALKSVQKIPSKQNYFNFYHWYITMSQFSRKEISSWAHDCDISVHDKVIGECIKLISEMKQNTQKPPSVLIDYILNIFIREPIQKNMMIVKNRLLNIRWNKAGEQLSIKIKQTKDQIDENKNCSNQIRILFSLSAKSCDKLKQMILKWEEVENIQIKKQTKA